MTTTRGNVAIVFLSAVGFFLFGVVPQLFVRDGGWAALLSPKFVISCTIAGLVFGIMIVESENPRLRPFSPWLRILAGGICGGAIATIWGTSLFTLMIFVAVGIAIGFLSRWLDF